MLKYVYIDESGDLGSASSSSKNLILAALIVNDPAFLERIIKNMRRYKFKKELKHANEIKANNSSEAVIKHMLLSLNAVPGARIHFIVLEKRKIVSSYLVQNKHKLYNFTAGKLAQNISLNNANIELFIDKTKGNHFLQEDFNVYFENKLREKSSIQKISFSHARSESSNGLQFADVLSWAAFQKFERGDSTYLDLLTAESEASFVWY